MEYETLIVEGHFESWENKVITAEKVEFEPFETGVRHIHDCKFLSSEVTVELEECDDDSDFDFEEPSEDEIPSLVNLDMPNVLSLTIKCNHWVPTISNISVPKLKTLVIDLTDDPREFLPRREDDSNESIDYSILDNLTSLTISGFVGPLLYGSMAFKENLRRLYLTLGENFPELEAMEFRELHRFSVVLCNNVTQVPRIKAPGLRSISIRHRGPSPLAAGTVENMVSQYQRLRRLTFSTSIGRDSNGQLISLENIILGERQQFLKTIYLSNTDVGFLSGKRLRFSNLETLVLENNLDNSDDAFHLDLVLPKLETLWVHTHNKSFKSSVIPNTRSTIICKTYTGPWIEGENHEMAKCPACGHNNEEVDQ